MPLSIHLSIHLLVAVLVGYLASRYFKKKSITFIAAVLGGFFIDLDHVLEYFLYYGWHFNIIYFLAGREFLLSNKIHLFFHAWEYIPVLLLAAYILRKRKNLAIFIVIFCIAGSFHLISDVFINKYPLKFYSISYRASQNFLASNLLSPEELQKNLESKKYLGI